MTIPCIAMAVTTCPSCGLRVVSPHSSPQHCIEALRARLFDPEPVFSLHNRRFRFLNHPDSESGQYVLVAGFGEGETMWTGSAHELALCLDDSIRRQLTALLQSVPEVTS
jgi:hypothetical protein